MREYQAWTTGGVSLITIAHWQQTSHPTLDVTQPWFKLGGKPPHEKVGYLSARKQRKRHSGTANGRQPPSRSRDVSARSAP